MIINLFLQCCLYKNYIKAEKQVQKSANIDWKGNPPQSPNVSIIESEDGEGNNEIVNIDWKGNFLQSPNVSIINSEDDKENNEIVNIDPRGLFSSKTKPFERVSFFIPPTSRSFSEDDLKRDHNSPGDKSNDFSLDDVSDVEGEGDEDVKNDEDNIPEGV